MPSDKRIMEHSTAQFFATLDSTFSDLAAAARVPVRAGRTSSVSQQGLFVAATGALESAKEDGGRNVGLLHISSPNGRSLVTAEGAEVRPGSYVFHVRDDGQVALRDGDGHTSVTAAPAEVDHERNDGGGIFYCGPGGYQFEVQYSHCQICVSLICPGVWEVLLICFSIPFCDIATGWFGE